MSIRARRVIVRISITLSVAVLGWTTVLTATGHHRGGRTVAATLFAAVAILSGALYLRSTQGRS